MNKKTEVTQAEQLEQWSNKAITSLSASLVFGRSSAGEIAQPLLKALFSLTSNDYNKSLEVIVKIDDFSVKRILLEQFKHSYILNKGPEDLFALVAKVDFSDQKMSDRYDSVLLKLFNENDKDAKRLSESLKVLPIAARRLALKRLHSQEFNNFKRVKITQKRLSKNVKEPVIKTWHWVFIFIVLATLAVTYGR